MVVLIDLSVRCADEDAIDAQSCVRPLDQVSPSTLMHPIHRIEKTATACEINVEDDCQEVES